MMRILTLIAVALLHPLSSHAYHKVGNGDDGGDLEGLKRLTEGPIVQARTEALTLLKKLNTVGVRYLSLLAPEVERSELFLVSEDKDINPETDSGVFHGNLQGKVFARTFAEPHAATRFFPASLALSSSQLVALHIHEALHRALPHWVREDEAKVGRITLAITSPGATHDGVAATVESTIPAPMTLARPADGLTARYQTDIPVGEYRRVSSLSYSYRHFLRPSETSSFPIYSMHVLQSDLYPFGGENTPFGMGLEGTIVSSLRGGTKPGPLGISARLRLWQRDGFDVGIWALASLNLLSNDELKNSPYGRDLFTFGTSMRKRTTHFYIENYLSYTGAGQTRQKIGSVEYLFQYGDVINAKLRTGLSYSFLDVGAFAELHLARYFRVSGGAFGPYDPGAYRLISVGPEITARFGAFSASIFGRILVDSTQGANFDYLGNLMGAGTAQGNLGSAVSYAF